MKTNDLFKQGRSAKKLNEGISKTFGKQIDLESFDLPKLEDARNKLRTQLHVARSSAGFNENLENDTYHEAQWMLDAINAEIAERQEFIADPHQAESSYDDDELEEVSTEKARQVHAARVAQYQQAKKTGSPEEIAQAQAKMKAAHQQYMAKDKQDIEKLFANRPKDPESIKKAAQAEYEYNKARGWSNEEVEQQSDADLDEVAPPGDKYERMVKHIKKGYASDGKLTPKEKSIAYATAWKAKKNEGLDEADNTYMGKVKSKKTGIELDVHAAEPADEQGRRTNTMIYLKDPETGKVLHKFLSSRDLETNYDWVKYPSKYEDVNDSEQFEESTTHGEDMKKLYEGEIQQAQSIVTAKTMVDRVGRWIEELSGMENDTLLQLGDQIRDEMSADQAKSFISTVAPAIQQALTALKSTRETLATGVRQLTGEEQGAEMLGAEPAAGEETFGAEPEMAPDMGGESEPDMMNPPEEGGASPDDAFAAAEPGAGGPESAGRAKRESIDFGNSLLKVLAG